MIRNCQVVWLTTKILKPPVDYDLYGQVSQFHGYLLCTVKLRESSVTALLAAAVPSNVISQICCIRYSLE